MKDVYLSRGLPSGKKVYCIGLKGSGVAAMAVLLKKWGYKVRGSDGADSFFTDKTLEFNGIACDRGFHVSDIDHDVDWVLYSPAYSRDDNKQLCYAFEKYQCVSYPELLGMISREMYSAAILGTHGKTSTTAYLAILCQSQEADATVLFGSAMPQFDQSGVYVKGKRFFAAEVCEYRNHFMHFMPSIVLLLNIDLDHPDTFESVDDVSKAIMGYIDAHKKNLDYIVTHVDTKRFFSSRYDVPIVTVGTSGDYHVVFKGIQNLKYTFTVDDSHKRVQAISKGTKAKRLPSYKETPLNQVTWRLPALNEKLIEDAALAIVLYRFLHQKFYHDKPIDWAKASKALENATTLQRRSQVLYSHKEVIVIDDYAHHPLAVRTTLQGIRDIYKPKKLLVSFMPHTYSRTKALLQDFIRCFDLADVCYLHPIYPTPREHKKPLDTLAQEFFEGVRSRVPESFFVHNHMDLVTQLANSLKSGDVFVTLGAGNNFELSHGLVQMLTQSQDVKTRATV